MARPSLHRKPAAQDAVLLSATRSPGRCRRCTDRQSRSPRDARASRLAPRSTGGRGVSVRGKPSSDRLRRTADRASRRRKPLQPAAVTESRYSPSGTWVNRHCGSIQRLITSTRKHCDANSLGPGGDCRAACAIGRGAVVGRQPSPRIVARAIGWVPEIPLASMVKVVLSSLYTGPGYCVPFSVRAAPAPVPPERGLP